VTSAVPPPQLEDALFQLASVIDSTSKHHYPNEGSSKKRFVQYIDSITTDLYRIATSGALTLVDFTFSGTDGNANSFGEIIYNIRCSSYHDPNEVDDLIYWGEENQIGHKDNRFIVNQRLLIALFLILISDDANKDHVDMSLFTDDHYLILNNKNYPFSRFIGKRDHMFGVLGLSS
jgi:hypothetical protein